MDKVIFPLIAVAVLMTTLLIAASALGFSLLLTGWIWVGVQNVWSMIFLGS